jgi:hypothetical protein
MDDADLDTVLVIARQVLRAAAGQPRGGRT